MNSTMNFNPDDLERIKNAVREAEKEISGEIVPIIVSHSDEYEESYWRAGFAFMSVSLAVLFFTRVINTSHPIFFLILLFVSGLIGAGLVKIIKSIRRLFIGKDLMNERTHEFAELVFLREEVFNTKSRTGILIFVSCFEQKVVILADKGINLKIDQKEWDYIIHLITHEIKKGNFTEGLIAGIYKCKEYLLDKGFFVEPDDINELADHLRRVDE